MKAVLAIVLLAAAAVRFVGLGFPAETIWDEHYYVLDAYSYLGATPDLAAPGAPDVRVPNEQTWEHPPLAKALVAVGEGPRGLTPWGYRTPSALFGLLAVVMAYCIARELELGENWSVLVAAAVAFDGLLIVQSRVALLDIFAMTFSLVALYLTLTWRRSNDTRMVLGAGLFAGCAVSSKWSALPVVLAIACGAGLVARRRNLGWWIVAFTIVPACTYLLAYGPFWASRPWDVGGFLELQRRMLEAQTGRHFASADASPAWSWPLLLRPIRYWPDPDVAVPSREVLALGNPVLWWGFLAAIPSAAMHVAHRRHRPALVVGVIGYLATWGPWLFSRRSAYFFYMTPAVPFMALTVAACLEGMGDRLRRHTAVAFSTALGLATVAFLPLWTGWPLPPWHTALRWLAHWT